MLEYRRPRPRANGLRHGRRAAQDRRERNSARRLSVMADFPSPRSPQTSASQSTRQLLDELDSLMQRMLAVPVQPVDSEPAPEAVAPAPRQVALVPVPGGLSNNAVEP